MKKIYSMIDTVLNNSDVQRTFNIVGVAILTIGILVLSLSAQTKPTIPDSIDAPYANMPAIAPIGVRVGKYMDIPDSAKGPTIDPAKGYRIQDLGKGLYMVTDNAYQSLFMVYEQGVLVVDAPPSYAQYIPKAISEVTEKPITYLIYSHYHSDHIGGASSLPGKPINIAQEETLRLLKRAKDPMRPLPTITFQDRYNLKAGSQTLELSYHGVGHAPGNIFIYAPVQKTLMVVDTVSPGWMPFRRLHLAEDVVGHYAQVEEIKAMKFDTLVGGHVERTGTKADVELYSDFLRDLKNTATESLKATAFGIGMDPRDLSNPWAGYDNFTDRVVVQCVNQMTPKWAKKLAAFDIFIWDQCYTVEQSLQID